MTEEEINKMREDFKKNELYQQSTSPYKDFQFEQFCGNGEVLEGQHTRTEIINGKKFK